MSAICDTEDWKLKKKKKTHKPGKYTIIDFILEMDCEPMVLTVKLSRLSVF